VILTASQPFAWKLCASNPEWFKYELIWEKGNGTNPLLVKKQPFRCHENILVFYKKQPTYNPQMTYGHSNYGGFCDNNKFIGDAYTGGEKQLISKHKENLNGSRYPRSVQKFKQERGGHPTKKPVDLMRWLIRTYSNENELVLDNVMGEGSTGKACILENRKFFGIELDKDFFEKAKLDILDISKKEKNRLKNEKRYKDLFEDSK
jgi:site-specific DNA-methyltransferase (adenine-specific)